MQTSDYMLEIMRLARLAHDVAKLIENVGTTEPGTLGRQSTGPQGHFDELEVLLTRIGTAVTDAGTAETALLATFTACT